MFDFKSCSEILTDISVCMCGYSRPTQPFILTGSINRVPTYQVGVKAGEGAVRLRRVADNTV